MKPWVRELLAVSLFVALAFVQTTITSDFGTRFFVGPDPAQDIWILSWITSHLITDPARVFEGNNFYPSHDAILFADPLIGPAVLVTPLRIFTANPILLYNAAFLLVLSLSSYGFYRLARRLSGDAASALLAGIVIPYTAQQTYHMSHLNLLTTAGYPFLLLSLFALLERPSAGPALAAGLAFALQAGTSGYHSFSCTLLCLLVAAWAWRDLRRPATLGYAAGAAAVAAVLLSPYVVGFARLRAAGSLQRSVEGITGYSVDLATGLFRTAAYVWQPWLRPENRPLFPGLIVLVFAAIGILRARGRHRRLLLLVAGVFFLLSLGPELQIFGRPLGPLPFRLLSDYVPLFNAVRHPVTFAVPAVMALGLLAVLGLQESGLSKRPAVLATLLALAFVETLSPRPPRQPRVTALPEVYTFLQRQPAGAILDLPLDDVESWQWWSVFHGMPTFGGMAAFEPRWYQEVYQRIHHEWPRKPAHQNMEEWASLRMLKANVPIRYVILHPRESGYTRTNIEATPDTFERLREFPNGDVVYRMRRGGRGSLLRRRFRDDQLASGRVMATLRGPEDGTVTVSFNDVILERRRLSADWQKAVFVVPVSRVTRGMNLVTLELEGAGAFELQDIDGEGS